MTLPPLPSFGRRSTPGRDFDFLVAGGGITGCVMAGLLVNRGLAAPGRVAVVAGGAPPVEAAPAAADSDWDLRVFALSRASQRLLSLCGAWELLPPHKVTPYERMCVWDERGGTPGSDTPGSDAAHRDSRDALCFDCAELGEPNLGHIVEGRALQARCRRAAAAAGVVFVDADILGIETGDDEVRLGLSDGRSVQGRLLIAADGVESRARRLLGIETAGHAYHQDALVAHVRTAKSHRNTAWQRFLAGGPLAFLPLSDGRSSIVWSAARAESARLRALDAGAFGAELERASGAVLGACELTTPVASFPLQLQYALEYVRPRAVLVGDAAHAVHPLAGQGLNLGLMDCAVLTDVLRAGGGGAAGCGEHGVLRRYERRRKSDNLLAAAAFDGLDRLFSNHSQALCAMRNAGLGAVGRVPLLRRALATRALGLSGDVPDFVRGGG